VYSETRPRDEIVSALRCMMQDVGGPRVHGARAVALEMLDFSEDALEEYALAIQGDPLYPWGFYARADLLLQLGRFAEAKKDLEVALRLNPRHPPSLVLRAAVLEQEGDVSRALESLSRALAIDPGANGAEGRNKRGLLLVRVGRLDEALVDYAEAVRLAQGQNDAHIRYNVAVATTLRDGCAANSELREAAIRGFTVGSIHRAYAEAAMEALCGSEASGRKAAHDISTRSGAIAEIFKVDPAWPENRVDRVTDEC
jgi:tetratricopeptide (TPR) repeat protein